MRQLMVIPSILILAGCCTAALADTGSLQLSLRDVITGYAVHGTVAFTGPQQLTVQTDENGRLTVTLLPGEYSIQASAQGYQPMTTHCGVTSEANLPFTLMMDRTSLPDSEQPQALSRLVRPGFTLLHGYVVDSKTGKPVADVQVRLQQAGAETETDQSGHYNLSAPTPKRSRNEEPGTDTLIFAKTDYEKVILRDLEISGGDLRFPAIDLSVRNSVIPRDGSISSRP